MHRPTFTILDERETEHGTAYDLRMGVGHYLRTFTEEGEVWWRASAGYDRPHWFTPPPQRIRQLERRFQKQIVREEREPFFHVPKGKPKQTAASYRRILAAQQRRRKKRQEAAREERRIGRQAQAKVTRRAA